MRILLSISLTLALAPYAFPQTAVSSLPKRLIGDYGYWSRTQTPPYSADQIPFQKLTHINHAGVSFDANGNLSVPSGFLEPELLTKAHNAGGKVLLLLGGDFSALETSPSVQTNLIANLKTFITANGYDGVDIDWEYPSTTADEQAFLSLFEALRDAFPRPNYLLSADVAPWGGSGYDFPQVTPIVNYFNIMTYDCAGPWTDDGQLNSPIFPDPNNPEPYECEPGGSVKEAIDIYVTQSNISPEKLNIGTPFYGYFYRNVTALYGPCKNCANSVLQKTTARLSSSESMRKAGRRISATLPEFRIYCEAMEIQGSLLTMTQVRRFIESRTRYGPEASAAASIGRSMRITTAVRKISWTQNIGPRHNRKTNVAAKRRARNEAPAHFHGVRLRARYSA